MFNKDKVIGGAFLLGICSAALMAVETPSEAVMAKDKFSPDMRYSVSRHTVGFLKKENDAKKRVAEANQLFLQERYKEACAVYIDAKKLLNELNKSSIEKSFQDKIAECDRQIELCYYEMANQALAKADASIAVNDYDEAIRLCREAAEKYPACKPVMDKKIARYTEIRKTVAIQNDTSENALLPEKGLEDYEISVMLRRARALVNAGLYDKAKKVYNDILLKNPYRSDVLQDLRAVNAYIRKSGQRRVLSSQRAAITANELEWALPIYRETEKTVETVEKPVEKVVEESNLAKKLKSIIIKSIEFEDTKLRTLLTTLMVLAERNDPEGIGVNIFLRQNLDAQSAGGEEAAAENTANQNEQKTENNDAENENTENEDEEENEDESSEEEDESSWTELEKTVLPLTTMNDKSLEDIIRAICTSAKLRYRVEKYAVVIEPLDMPQSDMITRIFPVDASNIGDATGKEDLQRLFDGVTFPTGSNIVYDAKLGRIFVTNTPDNLKRIEEICEETLNIQEPMVQVQLRIIEISQKDLHALGFNYTLRDNSTTDKAFSDFSTKNQLRAVGNTDGTSPTAHADFNMGEFALGVDIKALDDLTGKDVLASPRVTTLPGERVDIKLVTNTYFVEDYDEPEIEQNQAENGDMTYTYVGPFPNFESEPEPLGITFGVTPTIEKDGEYINLQLAPTVSSLVGWTEYNGTTEDGAPDSMRTPNIARRTFNTNVTVRDGETLVIGGIIEDNVSERKDKVPLLGDIPLIGRLFQSRTRTSEKKNLLIFVTPRLVKPDGTYLNDKANGLANFL